MPGKNIFKEPLRIFIALVAAFVINMVGFQLLTGIFKATGGLQGMDPAKINETLQRSPLFIALSGIISIFIMLAMVLLMKTLDKGSLKDLGISWGKDSIRRIIEGCVIAVTCTAFLVPVSVYTNMYSYVKQTLAFSNDYIVKFMAACFLVSVMRGFAEEFLFRGYIMKNLMDITGKRRAILISAFLYMLQDAIVSPKPMVVVSLLVVGVFFGYMYQTSGSLYLTAACHSALHFLLSAIASVEPAYFGPVVFMFKDNGEKYLFNIGIGTGKDFAFFFTFLVAFLVYYLVHRSLNTEKSGRRSTALQG